jgi:peptidoglycan hydrolase-like protein with peptidoglycan-binding domain/predicted Zn-dependent protease
MIISRRLYYFAVIFVAIFFAAEILYAQTRLSRNLYIGNSGADVTALQQYLKYTGDLEGEITGTYDENTQKAVQSWQCTKNIVCSGTPSTTGYGNLGPRTRAELIAATTGGDVEEIYAQIKRDSTPVITPTDSALTQIITQPTSPPLQLTQQEDGISLSAFVELLIALDVISPDKVQVARDFASKQLSSVQPTQDSLIIPTPTYSEQTLSETKVSTLLKGSRGQDVLKIQLFLRRTGDYTYPEITGFYGSVTEEAVKSYQRRNDIVSSGTPDTTGYGAVGPKTLALMDRGVTGNDNQSVSTNTSESSSLNVGSSTTDGVNESMKAQDKSLATIEGQYSQSYYQGYYQGSYNDYAQAYYQSYYQGSYASPTQTQTNTTPAVKTYAPSEIIILPVYVHLIKSSHSVVNSSYLVSEVQNMFSSRDGVNENYWKQANIRWDLKDVRTYNITDGSDTIYRNAYVSNNSSAAYDAIPALSNGSNMGNGFNVFIVGDFSSITSNGLYFSSGKTNSGLILQNGIAFISEKNNTNAGIEYATYIVAHELGHALSLDHFGNSTNMMSIGGSGVSTKPELRNNLTSDQIKSARAQAAIGEPGTPPEGSGR